MRKTSWTRLREIASAGDSVLLLRGAPVNWETGDKNVVASTSLIGTRLWLSLALLFMALQWRGDGLIAEVGF